MRLLSFLLLSASLAGCASVPSFDPVSVSPGRELGPLLTPEQQAFLDRATAFSVDGGPDDPSSDDLRTISMPSDRIPVLELHDVSISDLAKTLIVDHGRGALVMSGDLTARVDWSGGPFSYDAAVNALEDIVVSNGLSFRRTGDVVSIAPSDEGSVAISYGYTRVYRSSADAVVDALGKMFPNVKAAAVGRSVSVSGSSSDVADTLKLVRDLDRDTVSSLPWSVVRVSPEVSAEAVSVIETLADPKDPLAVRSFVASDTGVVLLVGYNRASVEEARAVLEAMSNGIEPQVFRVLSVDDPSGAQSALQAAFAREIDASSLTVTTSARELLLRGRASAVSDAYAVAQKFAGDLGFVDVQVVVAETVRGSAVDRSITLGHAGTGLSVASGRAGGGATLALGSGGFQAAVDWLERDTQTRLLTTSRLSIRSGGDGDLSVGSQIPIPGAETTNDDGTRTRGTEYRDTGVILRVSPRMLSDGRVAVQVDQEISTAGTNAVSSIDAPVFEQRRLATDLVVDPGELVSAGGLDYQASDEYAQAPLKFNPGGSSTARKLVILLSATPKTPDARRAQVQDQLSGLADLLKLEDR